MLAFTTGGMNSADRSLLTHLVFLVSQNPPQAHVFLNLGDKDFTNILHRLRMSNYHLSSWGCIRLYRGATIAGLKLFPMNRRPWLVLTLVSEMNSYPKGIVISEL
ncbi:hypothetical protein FRX31_033286 [Thalictrum thalictroides]|uniref:NYN domain-containing protein n=1 Tax=Thalictrum thalictroides TaxID=46969 RepID=A0A7J6UWZ8_THATH|nr:hypothetical protein FRX31_033286 [Thalictrum thalictroides]